MNRPVLTQNEECVARGCKKFNGMPKRFSDRQNVFFRFVATGGEYCVVDLDIDKVAGNNGELRAETLKKVEALNTLLVTATSTYNLQVWAKVEGTLDEFRKKCTQLFGECVDQQWPTFGKGTKANCRA